MAVRLRGERALAFAVLLVALASFTPLSLAEDTYSFLTMEVVVYRDGVAHVRGVITVNSTIALLSLPVMGEAANVIVTEERGQLLRYELTGSNIMVYTFGASKVVFEYDTPSLTRKDGPVWTLKLNLPALCKAVLPEGASIVYLSDKPTSIEAKEGQPVLILARGPWEISYVIPLQTTTTTATTQTSHIPPTAPSWPPILGVAVGIMTIALVVGLSIVLKRRSSLSSETLSPADSEVLQLISSRGGKIFESELRDSLRLPKTTVWRRVKKLEEMGLVRTRKVGSQNEIELS